MVICATCKKPFDSGKPQHMKSDEEKKVTFSFCSEACMKSYR